MSVKCMSWAWEIDGIKPIQKLVLCRLAFLANDDGICWPSKRVMAKTCSCSKRSIDDAIINLKDLGLISIFHRLESDGGDDTNIYVLSGAPR